MAKNGDEATHVRHEGEVVRQAEARHLITSFGRDEVNPLDPEQVAKAFEYVVARHAVLYPGEQATFVGQAEGIGGKFHVHTTRNATLYLDMEVDGKRYGAGRKLAGDLTDIDQMRERADRFLAEHGHEYDLVPQRLPSVSERKKEMRNQRDRRMAANGALSNHDQIRKAFEVSMDDPRAMDFETWKVVMAEYDVTVTEPGWRRGKPPKVPRLSYQLASMATAVRAKTLGEHYDHASALGQLDAKARGQPRGRRPAFVKAGNPRPASQASAADLAAAQKAMAYMAREERELRAAEDEMYDWVAARAHDQGVAFGDILNRLPESYEAQKRVMHRWNRLAEASEAQTKVAPGLPEEHGPGAPVEDTTMAESTSYRPGPVAFEPGPEAPDHDLFDHVIVDEALVQYGIYQADFAAMYKAGIEPRRIGVARELWASLSEDEQRERYLERKKDLQTLHQGEEVTPTPRDQDEMQSPQRLAPGLLEDMSVEEGLSQHTGLSGRHLRTEAPESEEGAHAAAARIERRRRDALRRWVLRGTDEPVPNEDEREFGA
ncbi:hypothetical protein [Arthrobacter alpinus]|uniref:hypothetical protein n=1 Tax=Arthrobacter alpinus TaxID=656366 RepID=UPI0012FC27CD|nr:hypothetical protein [Arthrobacter alpinus]